MPQITNTAELTQTTLSNTKHTTCRDLLLCVSVRDSLMPCIVFAQHNQS